MDHIFGLGNLLALTGWVALALGLFVKPLRGPAQVWAGLAIPLLLGAAYVGLLATAKGAHGGFGSIAQVRALFANDAVLTAGWFHYLAFDLFVGAWIAREAAARRIWPILVLPCLFLTFMFGPSGLLTFQVLRLPVVARQPRT